MPVRENENLRLAGKLTAKEAKISDNRDFIAAGALTGLAADQP
jgi:hypothetical protein